MLSDSRHARPRLLYLFEAPFRERIAVGVPRPKVFLVRGGKAAEHFGPFHLAPLYK